MSAPKLSGEEWIPDIVRSWPRTRRVLDRYGLRGCGGELGPAETVAYFSRAHDVDLTTLLRELEAAAELGVSEGVADDADRGDSVDPAAAIYKRFFMGGIFVALTAGAAWGAYLLLKLGFGGGFGALSVHDVNAHGHAQIFGWVGLFVMGFAYQAFPRFKHGTLKRPRLALATFPLYLAGLVARTAAEAYSTGEASLYAGALGSALEVAAIAIFCWIIAETVLGSSEKRNTSDAFILASSGWFLIQAVYEGCLFWGTMTAGSSDALQRIVATWQAPLRDIQIHGFASLMIFGVSLRYLPGMVGLSRVPEGIAIRGLVVLNTALVFGIAGFIGARLSSSWLFPWVRELSSLAYSLACVEIAVRLGILHRKAEPDRSVKMLRAAYAWLLISLLLRTLQPLYLLLTSQSFSHAYFGAIRHAVTVGFISLMIVGVASKVVPTLNGVPGAALPRLWIPFVLLNVGCGLRVVFQILTDLTPAAFPVAGVSGCLELTALALWSAHIVAVIAGRYRSAAMVRGDRPPAEALPGHNVGWLTEVAPQTIPVLARLGFSAIQSKALRETLARTVTLRQACRLKGIDEALVLRELNGVLAQATGCAVSATVAAPVEFLGKISRSTTP